MTKLGLGIALFFLFQTTHAEALKPNLSIFCEELLQAKPAISDYAASFTPAFRKNISQDELKYYFAGLYRDVGKCTSISFTQIDPTHTELILKGERKINAVLLVVRDQKTGLFDGLRINGTDDPAVQIHQWTDLASVFQHFDPIGKLSATLVSADQSVRLTENENTVFGIGSEFKLYVLGALEHAIEAGIHTWDEVLPVHEDWKSLASGKVYFLPAGQKVKLIDYATQMISISDNSAADHLLYFLGRDQVTAMLSPMGNAHEKSYLPFLSTLEMFKLKWAVKPEETASYLNADETKRLQILTSLQSVPRASVGTNGAQIDLPNLIDKLEWFATTPENCNAMFWLADRNSPEIRKVLSTSVPLLEGVGGALSHWAYAGYKGGSEAGVITMSFLLESKSKHRACLAVSWNNESALVSEYRFMDLTRKLLKFAESQIP